MLVITRKPSESGKTKSSVYIGESIKVQVIEIRGNNVILGIEAPQELKILRDELYISKMSNDYNRAPCHDIYVNYVDENDDNEGNH